MAEFFNKSPEFRWDGGFMVMTMPPTIIDHAIDMLWGVYYRVRDFVMAPKSLREIREQAVIEAVFERAYEKTYGG